MNQPTTISVDPGRVTLGTLNNVQPMGKTRRIVMQTTAQFAKAVPSVSHFKPTLNFVFATRCPGVNRYSFRMLCFRLLWGTLLIVSGVMALRGDSVASGVLDPSAWGIMVMSLGILSVLGLMGRLASLTGLGLYLVSAGVSVAAGRFDMLQPVMALVFLYSLVSGSGKYSCDFLLKKSVIRLARIRRVARRRRRLTYEAFKLSVE